MDVDRKDVYVPPTTYVSSYPSYGYPYYGSWYGYYSHGYTVTHDPGYTYEKVTVSLETNLYNASDEAIIWSGQSQTFDPKGVDDVIGPTVGMRPFTGLDATDFTPSICFTAAASLLSAYNDSNSRIAAAPSTWSLSTSDR